MLNPLKFTLLYYLKSFDASFGFFLREKEPQNLEEAFIVAIKIDRNISVAQNVQLPLARLFDPQARRPQDTPIKGLQEPKEEVAADKEEFPSKIVDLLNELSNKVVKMEKMHANQRPFQHKKLF
jgi:hypothetical protein